ncbi:MAG: hypothetical protein ABI411_11685 [Tahibacter sp.]
MKIRARAHRFSALAVFASASAIAIAGGLSPIPALAQSQEPIAYTGHGGFFDQSGNQIPLTLAFVEQAQAWYRADLMSGLDGAKKNEFLAYEKRLFENVPERGQARLVVRQRSLEWLFANSSKHRDDDRTLGKLRALATALKWQVPEHSDLTIIDKLEAFTLDADLARKLDLPAFKTDGGIHVLSATVNSGQAYLNECIAAKVPIPPPIGVLDPAGTAGWKTQGFIPPATQFIVGTPAELRTYKSATPAGMCYALPRYSDGSKTTVALDGVICLSQETSKVCIWDNQMSGTTFSFPAGTKIPIGVPDNAIDPMGRYQAGGFELLGGEGGVCTDCHAGENPYITHPKANLGGGVLWESLSVAPQNLPTFAPNRYDPLVAAAWPQNQLSQAGPTVPPECGACHFKGNAGRFPHLSNLLNGPSGYCKTILSQAITKTMPPGAPGTEIAAGNAFRDAYCGFPPNAATADAGDPHLTTTNGIHYDFQSAGEFVALKNSSTGFELQTRQSPVQTTFTPPANEYTGLASCVSLNTAVAARVGKHRVTFQQERGSAQRMQLRIDGTLVNLAAAPFDFGDGNIITKAGSGSAMGIRAADGTILTITPFFWNSQGYWYLDVDVRRTPAREGTLGPVLAGDWLPRAPDGTSFGPRPAALPDRHGVLNQKFANAWRVNKTTSLFDYAPGGSSADFTDTHWPPEPGKDCKTTLPSNPPLKRMNPDLAKQVCRGIKDPALLANCLFDVTVMGEAGAAAGYLPKAKTTAVAAPTTAPNE